MLIHCLLVSYGKHISTEAVDINVARKVEGERKRQRERENMHYDYISCLLYSVRYIQRRAIGHKLFLVFLLYIVCFSKLY